MTPSKHRPARRLSLSDGEPVSREIGRLSRGNAHSDPTHSIRATSTYAVRHVHVRPGLHQGHRHLQSVSLSG